MLFAPADDVLPRFFLGLFLFVREGRGDGVVDCGAVGGPREGVHVELLRIKRQSLSAGYRDDPQAARFG